ncbi:MAG: CvpA family protein, partial [Bryobacteraceae bacterium]
MSLLDLLLAVIVGVSVVSGFVAGFARAGLGFIASIAGVLFGFWFYGVPGAKIHEHVKSVTFSNLLGFLVVFFLFVTVGALLGKLLAKLFKWTGLSWLDRLLGAGFGLVRGSLVALAFVAVLMAFTPKPPPHWMVGSFLLPYAIDASNVCAAVAPRELKDAVHDTMNEIRRAWDEEVQKSRQKSEPKK